MARRRDELSAHIETRRLEVRVTVHRRELWLGGDRRCPGAGSALRPPRYHHRGT